MTDSVILVTGGAGYIGSHTVVQLLESGYEVVVVDNLANSSRESLRRVEQITGRRLRGFHEVDLVNVAALDAVFEQYKVAAVIHFAGLKAVGESVAQPLKYYETNITGAINLLNVMSKHAVKDLVFSSSATVYGAVQQVPEGGLSEESPLGATNPYGYCKLFIEQILRDTQLADPACNFVLLRYFNPVGAHASGLIGEDPKGIPNNLMPYVSQVAVGKRPFVSVYGNDYSTIDGTGVRDYIHVVDLAAGHLAALKLLDKRPGAVAINLGTGRGQSVLQMIAAMEKACGKTIAYKIVERRPGDVGSVFASVDKAKQLLGWEAKLSMDRACEDAWRWQSTNPDGFAK
eukprot:TRINITY_DN6381_c0_g1_i1.p1 TRINITY_DN6381_c0_g1~~TRINITY_DN6381_c0_g1_i1.p1  ORF type:complete len:345 (+),score=136.63 TRINITY_DN6381_c0_g1_i1:126-1160(+)